jgi:glycogen synthase
MGSGKSKIAFVAYETPYAPCGGISAVMDYLPAAMAAESGLETIVISPLHFRSEKLCRLAFSGGLSIAARFELNTLGQRAKMLLLKVRDAQPGWYFITPQGGDPFSPALFSGQPHPYRLHPDSARNTQLLLRDSLVFGQAVVQSLAALDPKADWRLLLQDWEAATVALALAAAKPEPPVSARAWLTLHNSYDCPLYEPALNEVGLDPEAVPDIAQIENPAQESDPTVLRGALPHLESTVFTVSRQYALDLCEDLFQARIMAAHLQEWLGTGGNKPYRLVGIDNGCFQKPALPTKALDAIARGDIEPMQTWKEANRTAFLDALLNHQSSDEQPLWGDAQRFAQKSAGLTWFAMGGRDDPRQKGYDVMVSAVRRFLAEGGQAGFLFFPIPGDEGLAGLNFMRKLTWEHPGMVLALPFRFSSGYMAAMHGASFGVMPSLYEPFGGANEFYLWGSLGLARATGGLVEQINPVGGAGHELAREMAAPWHRPGDSPSGVLFRESGDISSALDDWQGINQAGYSLTGEGPDRVEQRSTLPLFQAMAHELKSALETCDRLYQDEPEDYFGMLKAGYDLVTSRFTWQICAREYLEWIFK